MGWRSIPSTAMRAGGARARQPVAASHRADPHLRPPGPERRLASAPARRQGGHQVRRDGRDHHLGAVQGRGRRARARVHPGRLHHRGARLRRLAPAPALHQGPHVPAGLGGQHGHQGLPGGRPRRQGRRHRLRLQVLPAERRDRPRLHPPLRARLRLRVRDRGRQVPVPQGGRSQGRAGRAALRRAPAHLPSAGVGGAAGRQRRGARLGLAGKREIVGQATARRAPRRRRSAATTSEGVRRLDGAGRGPHDRGLRGGQQDGPGDDRPPGRGVRRGRGDLPRQPRRAGRQGDQDRVARAPS